MLNCLCFQGPLQYHSSLLISYLVSNASLLLPDGSGCQHLPCFSLCVSANAPFFCTIPHTWEEIFVNACWATALSPSNPSLTPLCSGACRDHADSLVMCYDYCQYGPMVSVRSPVWIHLFPLLLCSGYAYVPVTVTGRTTGEPK